MTRPGSCPSPVELERAFWVGDAPAALHAEECAECRAEWARMAELVRLGRALPVPPPSAERREELRTRLVSRSERGPRAVPRGLRWSVAVPLAAAAAAAVALAGWAVGREAAPRTQPAPPVAAGPVHRGRVLAHDGARFLLASDSPDEIVRLVEGTLSVEVDRLRRGERFRVIAGDGEVEVRGTAFDVTVHDDRLVAVRVMHGFVDVRAAGVVRRLLAGDRWSAPEPVTLVAPPATSGARGRGRGQGEAPASVAIADDGAGGTSPRDAGPVAGTARAEPSSTEHAAWRAAARGLAVGPRAAQGSSARTQVARAHDERAEDERSDEERSDDERAQNARAGAVTEPQPPALPASDPGAVSALDAAALADLDPGAGAPAEATAPAAVAAPARTAAQEAFDAGFRALRAGDFAGAAASFAAVDQADGREPGVQADAGYWRCVALARAGRRDPAIDAFRGFLRAHSGSPRAAEASAMLGWLLVERGDRADAERAFRQAARDPSDRVRRSATEGLRRTAR